MDTRLKYREIIKSVMQKYADYYTTISQGDNIQVLFDDERGQYLILDMGWNLDEYLHNTPIHLSLINDKIWIQYDDTEEGVATDLILAGVPKTDIVLGFRHPKVRQYTGFAVA